MQQETKVKRDDTYYSTDSKVRVLKWALLNDFVFDTRYQGKIFATKQFPNYLIDVNVSKSYMSQLHEVENINKINIVYNTMAQMFGLKIQKPDDELQQKGDLVVAVKNQEYDDEYYVDNVLKVSNLKNRVEYVERLKNNADILLEKLTKDDNFKPEVAQSLAIALTAPNFKKLDPQLDLTDLIEKYGLKAFKEGEQPGLRPLTGQDFENAIKERDLGE